MRRFATIAIVLGLLGGLLAMFALSELSGRAGAEGSRHEHSEVSLWTGFAYAEPGPEAYRDSWAAVAFDSTNFPDDAVFTFDVGGIIAVAGNEWCFRLAEVFEPNIINPIDGTEVCAQSSSDWEYFGVRSGQVQLSEGYHSFTFQYKHVIGASGEEVDGGSARVVAEWTEPSGVVGGIAVLPDISDSPAQNYAIAAVLALVAVVAFAAGGWYARRRWLG